MSSGEQGKRPVRVTIYNQSYNLLASGEPGLTESLAQYVDELMNNIAQKIGGSDSTRVAVLAGLHLADRASALERELERFNQRVAALNQRCAGLLEAAVEDGSAGPKPAASRKAADADSG
jgi:cell division protein ZapA (FtsZ GTPase activity inhibitor)